MPTPASILEDARKVPAKSELGPHLDAIRALREKKWSWREIADFLGERGVATDHTKLIRFMQKHSDRFIIPSQDAYYKALLKLRGRGKLDLESPWWAMLNIHFDAHNRTVTYTQLAEAAGRAGAKLPASKPWTYANREYGTLGKVLGEGVGMNFLPSSKRDAPFYSSAIGIDNPALPDGAEYELVMHHELAKALHRLLADEKFTNQLGEVQHA